MNERLELQWISNASLVKQKQTIVQRADIEPNGSMDHDDIQRIIQKILGVD